MQGSVWVQLLQRIPEKQYENLVLVTTAGAEIMVQRIICHEESFMILRGRPAGSTEVARTILLPFDQLNYLAFHKPILERDVLSMFATESTVVPAPPSKPNADTPREDLENAPEESPSVTAESSAPSQPASQPEASRSGPPSKSILLARLRARIGKK
ncbi:MAG: hypothetical protein FJ271_17475 [Planctomycetes bacterium]|nr:hypothetical protein [Planctomycetota bacterium]